MQLLICYFTKDGIQRGSIRKQKGLMTWPNWKMTSASISWSSNSRKRDLWGISELGHMSVWIDFMHSFHFHENSLKWVPSQTIISINYLKVAHFDLKQSFVQNTTILACTDSLVYSLALHLRHWLCWKREIVFFKQHFWIYDFMPKIP